MIDNIFWQLTLCEERHDLTPTYQEDSMIEPQEHESAITPGTNDRSVIKTNSLENDVKILTETYGPLFPEKYIEIDLESACTLLHRHRHRIDAFSRLIKYLYQNYQTTLKITSRKNH